MENKVVNLELWLLIIRDALNNGDIEEALEILEHLIRGVRGE